MGLLQATYPDIISVEEIGETYEHRKYKVVHFTVPSSEGNDDHGDRRTVVVSGGIHAREWISTSSVLYSIYALIEFYKMHLIRISGLNWTLYLFLFLTLTGMNTLGPQNRLWRIVNQLFIPNALELILIILTIIIGQDQVIGHAVKIQW